MEFGGNNKRRAVKYPLRVQLYDNPPEDDISLEQFYILGKKRMEGNEAILYLRSYAHLYYLNFTTIYSSTRR